MLLALLAAAILLLLAALGALLRRLPSGWAAKNKCQVTHLLRSKVGESQL